MDVRRFQQQFPRVDRRLTIKHLDMNNYAKMDVQTAVDIISEPIEKVLLEIDAFGTSSKA